MILHARYLLATAAALGATSVSLAEEQSSAGIDAAALFAQLDANGDGLLTADEIPADKRTLFERLVRLGDGNSDGKLSADEFAIGLRGGKQQPAASKLQPTGQPAARPGRPGKAERPGPGQLFVRLDANGDGKVTLDEVPEPQRARFERLLARGDKDGDGALSRREFAAVGAVQPASTTRPAAGGDAAAMFRRLDANGDGKLVAAEVPENRRQFITNLIQRADTDGDGALSLEEFSAAMQRMRTAADTSRPRRPAAAPAAPSEPTAAEPKATEAPAAPAKNKKKAQQVSAKKPQRAAAADEEATTPQILFAALDADGDGQLSASEISAAPSVLSRFDRDGDGALSKRELAAASRKAQKQQTKKNKTK